MPTDPIEDLKQQAASALELRKVEALESIAEQLKLLTSSLQGYGRGGRNSFSVHQVNH